MALLYETGPNGEPHYRQDPIDPDKPVMFTGNVKGNIKLEDGTIYNVSDDWIEVESHAHAGELSHHIGVRHETEGHPAHLSRSHPDYDPFRDEYHHTCTEACGGLQRTADQHAEQFIARIGRELPPEHVDYLRGLYAQANGGTR